MNLKYAILDDSNIMIIMGFNNGRISFMIFLI